MKALHRNADSGGSPEPDRLISKREAAEIMGVSVRTIEREVAAGKLPRSRVRGCVRFRLSDVFRIAGFNSHPVRP
jgi:excisionase family DNA binding protein